ncbi:type II toxin-antitoxin system PemK/MazF family toxin [Paenibacillus sp. UASWS1643]|uniref:type II toxin-antitoxin system PemK/MazF family toxin n=1 Tax=Paenibacillus sp. UASWS1643 TaxID=2580422 RepID=UPI001239415E|nr:type II toxin-antitoxin system PemK/MazF family toxin [Paenibacillus sp. UASWS1643]KAA8750068.1 type II toxin-antitoxin system PemK/MazF family toxin [Paenibacillus sp. UASWS1643]
MIKRGGLFMINYGDGEGSEQQGYRPGLVIQNDVGNEFSPTVIVVAITDGEDKRLMPTHFPIGIKEGMRKPSVVMFEQIRTIDKTRLDYQFGSLTPEILKQMEHPLMISLGLKAAPKPRRKTVTK